MNGIAAAARIAEKIFLIRGIRIILDHDLAHMYGVSNKALNQAVRRNLDRFPPSFMFRLDRIETQELIAKCDRFRSLKHSNLPPMAFTEYGVAMMSSILRSRRAIRVNIEIIQTFIRLRRLILDQDELARKLTALEGKSKLHDRQIRKVLQTLQELIDAPEPSRRPIGFRPSHEEKGISGARKARCRGRG